MGTMTSLAINNITISVAKNDYIESYAFLFESYEFKDCIVKHPFYTHENEKALVNNIKNVKSRLNAFGYFEDRCEEIFSKLSEILCIKERISLSYTLFKRAVLSIDFVNTNDIEIENKKKIIHIL